MWTWEPWIVGMTMLRAGRGIDNFCGNRVATMVAQWSLNGRSMVAQWTLQWSLVKRRVL